MIKILLDCCCGPCSIPAFEKLNADKTSSEIIFFINDSNVYPKEEYEKRLEALKTVSEHYKKQLHIDKYEPEKWLKFVTFDGFEKEPEGGKRCEKCYEFRLRKTAEFAKNNNFSKFTTSLSTGPLKDAKVINKLGKQIAKEVNLNFIEEDFKQNGGHQQSIKKSKELGIYRQNYCGCKFSIKKLP